mmetsp:Transcript_22052/g.33462  ORF Transcript_22052/g.33462 Transcript_22052/m.33462 type:complete len:199 (+) Transcript_22052:82-678(+)
MIYCCQTTRFLFSRRGGSLLVGSRLNAVGPALSPHSTSLSFLYRYYTPMSPTEEEEENTRVSKLSATQKDDELRKLNRKISLLNMKQGILTGDYYTYKGKFKSLVLEYGAPIFVWYYTVWISGFAMVYGGLQVGQSMGFLDVMELISKVEAYTGYNLDPTLGTLALTLALNELLEPARIPFVIFTAKPVANYFFPPKF